MCSEYPAMCGASLLPVRRGRRGRAQRARFRSGLRRQPLTVLLKTVPARQHCVVVDRTGRSDRLARALGLGDGAVDARGQLLAQMPHVPNVAGSPALRPLRSG